MECKTEFKRWCAEKGLTALKVAEETGISQHTIWAYMRGVRQPNRRNAKKLEETYGVNSRELFPL